MHRERRRGGFSRKAIELDSRRAGGPPWPQAFHSFILERPEEALAAFDRCLERQPFREAALRGQAVALHMLSRYQEGSGDPTSGSWLGMRGRRSYWATRSRWRSATAITAAGAELPPGCSRSSACLARGARRSRAGRVCEARRRCRVSLLRRAGGSTPRPFPQAGSIMGSRCRS